MIDSKSRWYCINVRNNHIDERNNQKIKKIPEKKKKIILRAKKVIEFGWGNERKRKKNRNGRIKKQKALLVKYGVLVIGNL